MTAKMQLYTRRKAFLYAQVIFIIRLLKFLFYHLALEKVLF